MNEQSVDECEVIERLADSFVSQYREGQRPSIEEYARRHPDLAGELRELLKAIVLLERQAAACESNGDGRAAHENVTPPPKAIGEFTIVREVGRGGMGVVYEAVQESLGRHVALKVLSLPTLLNPKHLERFRFEARAAARLQHPHIVPVFGVGEVNGLHYYAMQFIHGQSLLEVVGELRKLDPSKSSPTIANGSSSFATTSCTGREFYRNVARIGLQVAEALAYAHSEGVLHRDIKPSNLLLDAKNDVWVTDFGLAKAEGTEGLTETGDFVGTLRYMAPERLEGAFDRRSDIYSLGATLYELLTLQSFFDSHSHARLVDKILNESPPAPSRFARTVPRDLETIILKAIAKEPAARYRTAEEMAEDLRRFLGDMPILSRRPAATEQLVRWCRRNPLVATLASTVAVLLVAAVIILTWSNARIRSEVAAKDNAMISARNAVHDLLARVASEKLSNVPMSHPLRVQLLEDALKAYEGLIALGDTNPAIHLQMADVLHSIAGLQRELGRDAEAESALKRSRELYALVADSDPNPPAIRETMAMVEADLAYTYQFDTHSPGYKTFPVEAQYRQALASFEAIERDWPQRRQPVTICLRYLADLANRRGAKESAEQLWRDAIARGETYLAQRPTNLQVRNDICWACMEYYEAILKSSPNRASDAEAMLAKGVQHAEAMKRQVPESCQAADVLAALHFRQALLCCGAGKIDEALPIFQLAIGENQSLCDSVPWNTDYWNTAQWFQAEAIRNLHKANRKEDLATLVEQREAWLQKMAKKGSNDERVKRKVAEAHAEFAKLIRSSRLDADAEKLSTKVE